MQNIELIKPDVVVHVQDALALDFEMTVVYVLRH